MTTIGASLAEAYVMRKLYKEKLMNENHRQNSNNMEIKKTSAKSSGWSVINAGDEARRPERKEGGAGSTAEKRTNKAGGCFPWTIRTRASHGGGGGSGSSNNNGKIHPNI